MAKRAALLRRKPRRTPDQWADAERVLPLGNAEPGPFRSSRTPYMIPIARAFVDPAVKMIVGVVGAQMAKSETVMNVIGHRLDDDPTPIIYYAPTQKLAESVSSDRFAKMLKSSRSLWDKLAKGKANKISEKWIGGVRLGFGWAGSATELSSHAAGLVLIDERDRMKDVAGEGDPVEMGRARISTYADGKVGVISTPTEGNLLTVVDEHGLERWGDLEIAEDDAEAKAAASPIWQLWQEGTRQEWAWPCPECDVYFIPRMKHLAYPEHATPTEAKREARLACPSCGALIPDGKKKEMNERGVFLAPGQRVVDGKVVGEVAPNECVSFWVSGLCSPWKTFGDRARALVAAKRAGAPERIRGVVNLDFGELYQVGGEAPQWEDVRELRGGYESGTLPYGVQVLTCGVDVQKNRLVYVVRGWGWNSESWLVEEGEIWSEPRYATAWTELATKVLERDFGGGLRIRLMLVDSGYNPGEVDRNPDNQIYLFCRRHRGRAAPSKGHDKRDKPFSASKIDVSERGKIFKNGLDLWHLDTDYFKSWVHSRIAWPVGEAGGWHLPTNVTEDYCKQLVAEARTTSPSTGKVVWVRLRRENHKLDCEALNVAAGHILRVHALPKLPEPKTGEEEAVAVEKPQETGARRRMLAPPRRGGWTRNWPR